MSCGCAGTAGAPAGSVRLESPVRTIRFRGYRRLSGKNILEHEKRHLIYTTILMNPGIGIPALASLTDINLHTLRYHRGFLIHMKKIACIEQGNGYHFFEKSRAV